MSETEAKKQHIALKRTIGIVSFLIFLVLLVWVTLEIGTPLIKHYFVKSDSDSAKAMAFSEMFNNFPNNVVPFFKSNFGSINMNDVDTGYFSGLVENNPVSGRLIFIGIQILQVFVAFIPGEVVEVAAGAIFGPIEGALLSLIGVTIGSVIIFLFTKWLGIKFVSLFVSEEKINSMKFIKNDRRLNNLVFIIFFIPGTPKDLLTYFVGLTRMKLLTFLGISLIARIPSIITSTFAGDAINNNDFKSALIIFAVTAVVSLIGILIYNLIVRKKNISQPETAEETEAIEETASAEETAAEEAAESDTAEESAEERSETITE